MQTVNTICSILASFYSTCNYRYS